MSNGEQRTDVTQPQGSGSPSFCLAAHERREIYILAAKWAAAGACAVLGLYLSKLDLGPWNALLIPLAVAAKETAAKFFPDTRIDSRGP